MPTKRGGLPIMNDVVRLEARIASLKELRDLFTAMQALAASRVQAAHTALLSAKAYARAIERAISDAAALQTPGPATQDDGGPASPVLIVFCSEHGFAGAFNRILLERARLVRVPGEQVVIVGSRGASMAQEYDLTSAWNSPMATHVDGILESGRRLAARLEASESIRVIHGSYQTGARFEAQLRQILPLPLERLLRPPDRAAPLHQLPPPRLLQQLFEEFLLAELVLALAESFASENAARLQIMQSASHNIAGKLDELSRRTLRSRQEAITTELLEVVIGGEAVQRTGA
ncbi:MAG: F0F1 ATP synthase subunit gamma [Hyphomicrobiaceae bacterium]